LRRWRRGGAADQAFARAGYRSRRSRPRNPTQRCSTPRIGHRRRKIGNMRVTRVEARRLLCGRVMRSRTLLGEVQHDTKQAARPDTYESVRRTLDEALAELQLPNHDKDDSGVIKLSSER